MKEFKIFSTEVSFQRIMLENPILGICTCITESIGQSIDNGKFGCGIFSDL